MSIAKWIRAKYLKVKEKIQSVKPEMLEMPDPYQIAESEVEHEVENRLEELTSALESLPFSKWHFDQSMERMSINLPRPIVGVERLAVSSRGLLYCVDDHDNWRFCGQTKHLKILYWQICDYKKAEESQKRNKELQIQLPKLITAVKQISG